MDGNQRDQPQTFDKAINAKLCVERYAKSSANGANLCIQSYRKIVTEQALRMNKIFKRICDYIYSRDKDSNFYRTVEDDVVEVLTEEQLKSRYSTYTNYIENFMRVRLLRRNIAFWQIRRNWSKRVRRLFVAECSPMRTLRMVLITIQFILQISYGFTLEEVQVRKTVEMSRLKPPGCIFSA